MAAPEIRQMIYESKSGTQTILEFDSVGRSGGRKASLHEFPMQDNPVVQDLGKLSEKFTIDCYISGSDYPGLADQFYDSLLEEGPGKLQHPRYGDLSIQVFDVVQSEGLVEGVGRASFKISFVRVPDREGYPSSIILNDALISQINDDLLAQSITDFENGFNPLNTEDRIGNRENILSTISNFSENLTSAISGDDGITSQVNSQVRDIENNIDALILQPSLLADSLTALLRLPASAATRVQSKVNGYVSSIQNLANQVPRTLSQAYSLWISVTGFVAGLTECQASGEIETRSDAVFISDTIQTGSDSVTEITENLENLSIDFTSKLEINSSIKQAITDAKYDLIEKAFSLKTERKKTLDESRDILTLVCELYEIDGNIDDKLDEFIRINKLIGSEILLLSSGKSVIWYE